MARKINAASSLETLFTRRVQLEASIRAAQELANQILEGTVPEPLPSTQDYVRVYQILPQDRDELDRIVRLIEQKQQARALVREAIAPATDLAKARAAFTTRTKRDLDARRRRVCTQCMSHETSIKTEIEALLADPDPESSDRVAMILMAHFDRQAEMFTQASRDLGSWMLQQMED